MTVKYTLYGTEHSTTISNKKECLEFWFKITQNPTYTNVVMMKEEN
ncbi:MAG: hypothetical protein SO152_06400 [Ruminococcus sp.]|nr:hypothetical protein [Ruminococcus sp.]